MLGEAFNATEGGSYGKLVNVDIGGRDISKPMEVKKG